jgi:hypothetical protein
MAGILDPKSRIMDVVLTQQGRQQIASGRMKIEYASFTDLGASYDATTDFVIEDPTTKIYMEALTDVSADMITFETDDSGYLRPFTGDGAAITSGGSFLTGGNLLSGSADLTGSLSQASDFLLQSITQSLGWNQIIATSDPLSETTGFQVSQPSISFNVREGFPFDPARGDVEVATLDTIESLQNDMRLSNLPNFKYLPPVNAAGSLAGKTLADYPDYNEKTDTDRVAMQSRLSQLESAEITFLETSSENNFIMQVFEIYQGDSTNPASIKKLDAIDYGYRSSLEDPQKLVRTIFLGKIYFDSSNDPTFINMFTLELE